ncbi:hypothetical protein Ddye_015339 [Dipteronia dyeriana]|uniref:Uncharacterized protein n=1 Tax=Dipteronia dyeriana TaxID=168575 RepID=A0AAD9WZG6_9ROSI|nr:hypothetical protein Ddye_015339 [Dipteronia dyeriana]
MTTGRVRVGFVKSKPSPVKIFLTHVRPPTCLPSNPRRFKAELEITNDRFLDDEEDDKDDDDFIYTTNDDEAKYKEEKEVEESLPRVSDSGQGVSVTKRSE